MSMCYFLRWHYLVITVTPFPSIFGAEKKQLPESSPLGSRAETCCPPMYVPLILPERRFRLWTWNNQAPLGWSWHGKTEVYLPPLKFNSSPLKIYQNPIGKDRLPTTNHHFLGASCWNLKGVIILSFRIQLLHSGRGEGVTFQNYLFDFLGIFHRIGLVTFHVVV